METVVMHDETKKITDHIALTTRQLALRRFWWGFYFVLNLAAIILSYKLQFLHIMVSAICGASAIYATWMFFQHKIQKGELPKLYAECFCRDYPPASNYIAQLDRLNRQLTRRELCGICAEAGNDFYEKWRNEIQSKIFG